MTTTTMRTKVWVTQQQLNDLTVAVAEAIDKNRGDTTLLDLHDEIAVARTRFHNTTTNPTQVLKALGMTENTTPLTVTHAEREILNRIIESIPTPQPGKGTP